MRSALLSFVTVILVACSPLAGTHPASFEEPEAMPARPTTTPRVNLPDLGPAPELTNTVWLNTPDGKPLRLAALRGSVVAVDFWTFG
jgi:hypothetical protein